jgi:hypothetical protein
MNRRPVAQRHRARRRRDAQISYIRAHLGGGSTDPPPGASNAGG